jgi:hypothetical protein
MPDRIEFRYAPQKQLALLGIGFLLVASSLLVALTTADVVYRSAGWIGAAFFALCMGVAARRLVSGGTPFVFDLAGIAFPGGTFGIMPWTDIQEYAVVTIRGNEFLALTFHDPERILSRMSAAKRQWAIANQRLGWGHWALSFTGVTPGLDEAVAFIGEHALVRPRA